MDEIVKDKNTNVESGKNLNKITIFDTIEEPIFSPSVFGGTATTTTTMTSSSSVFGHAGSTSDSALIFGGGTSGISSIFGGSKSAFGAASTSQTVTTTSAEAATSSIFGGNGSSSGGGGFFGGLVSDPNPANEEMDEIAKDKNTNVELGKNLSKSTINNVANVNLCMLLNYL